jgi:hypothetical protein
MFSANNQVIFKITRYESFSQKENQVENRIGNEGTKKEKFFK